MHPRFSFIFCVLLTTLLAASNAGADSRRALSQEALLVALAPRLSPTVARLALDASRCAAQSETSGRIDKLAVIDYSLPSTEKRFWLFDLQNKKLLLEEFVAHGKNTGENEALNFSNRPGSLQSSIGLFRMGERYVGKHGDSLRLIGLEPGVNDAAYERDLVIHGADYVSSNFINSFQRLGRSFGCPALAPEAATKAIETLSKGSSFLFSYYPDRRWLRTSNFLNSCKRF